MNTIFLIVSFIVLTLATITDIAKGKVYWWSTLPVLLFGMIAQLFYLGAVDYLIRIAVIVALFFLYEGFIGGGDAKLVMMLTMLHGPISGLLTLGIASLLVFVVSFIKDPDLTMNSAKNGLIALQTRTLETAKGNGPKVLLAPYMLVAFSLLVLVFGMY